jgi:20S proteasome alpha/beta subunit
MTVCIAAIAEANTKYPKIIIAADRQVSTFINYTSGVGKIRPITKYCWVMAATNDALVSDDIIAKSVEKLKSFPQPESEMITVEQIVKVIADECKNRLDVERERAILSPHGLDYDSYIKRSREMSREHIEILTNDLKFFEINDYKFKVDFLVVGIDSEPHIFTIHQNGTYDSSDAEGFEVIGSGKVTAFPEITKLLYHPQVNWLFALHRVYNSKKVAERVGGVGPETDLIVLHAVEGGKVGYWDANDGTKKLLDSSIEKASKEEIRIYSEVLSKFSDLLQSEAKN